MRPGLRLSALLLGLFLIPNPVGILTAWAGGGEDCCEEAENCCDSPCAEEPCPENQVSLRGGFVLANCHLSHRTMGEAPIHRPYSAFGAAYRRQVRPWIAAGVSMDHFRVSGRAALTALGLHARFCVLRMGPACAFVELGPSFRAGTAPGPDGQGSVNRFGAGYAGALGASAMLCNGWGAELSATAESPFARDSRIGAAGHLLVGARLGVTRGF